MRFMIPDLADPNAHPRAVRRAVGHRAAEVRQAWRDHNERIRPLLPPPLRRLQETQLHDALLQSLRLDPTRSTLQLCLLCDDDDGYYDLRLDYRDIRLTPQETSLLCLIAHVGAEVDRDEIDLAPAKGGGGSLPGGGESPVFIHRISWHTCVQTGREATGLNGFGEECCVVHRLHPEIEFRFGGLEMETVRRSDRGLSRSEDFITVVRDPARIEGMDSVS